MMRSYLDSRADDMKESQADADGGVCDTVRKVLHGRGKPVMTTNLETLVQGDRRTLVGVLPQFPHTQVLVYVVHIIYNVPGGGLNATLVYMPMNMQL